MFEKLLLKLRGKPKSLDEKIKETAKQIKAERRLSLLISFTLLAITILAVFVLRDAKIAFGYGQITMVEHQLVACSMLLMILSFGFGFLYVEYMGLLTKIKNVNYRLEKLEKESVDGGA